jgi:hypothetical protein
MLLLLLGSLAGTAWTQVPVGPEFQANSYALDAQRIAAVAGDAAGNFIVVWESTGQDGDNRGIFGQRYAASGARRGGEFQVNSYTTNYQERPSVASDANGNVLVVWSSFGQDGDGRGLFAQRFDALGMRQGGEFQVNTHTTGTQRAFRAGVAASGSGFVVAWTSQGQDGSDYGIFARRFDTSGMPQGVEFQVSSYTTARQRRLSVASDAGGNFVVVWDSQGQDGSLYGVFGQRFGASGARLGAEFRVNSFTTGLQLDPHVAISASGGFLVVWTSQGQDGTLASVFGQRYDASGMSQGGEFQVNSYTTSYQYTASAAAVADGEFVVVWNSFTQDGDLGGVFARHFDASGAPRGAEFQVNSYTTGYQYFAGIAAAAEGRFVVTWHGDYQDGSSYGIFGQRFAPDPIFADGFE